MVFEYKPDRWDTTPFDPTRCKASVSDGGRWPKYHQCKRVPWQDGWCQQHHPLTRARWLEQSRQRYERRLESSPVHQLGIAQERIATLEAQRDELLAACEKVQDMLNTLTQAGLVESIHVNGLNEAIARAKETEEE